ncbi:MAG: ATP-dependent helicase [Desulfovibrio sp.]
MIDFKNELNEAQYEAACHTEGPLLVIAGAGSGKTRTLVYRLAHLVEDGIPPEHILLLTFTKKAAQEMLLRASTILDRHLSGTAGGTFHSYAYTTLRRYATRMGYPNGFTLLDRSDCENIMKDVKEGLKLGKGDRSFPKKGMLLDIVTKSRNKEKQISDIIETEAFHLIPYADDVAAIARGYVQYKIDHALMDYDDLLFHLDRLLTEHPDVREHLRNVHKYIMVDEYQDTNLVQARIVRHLAGKNGNVMAVGDDAQSIYAFRGANVENILKFPQIFSNTKIIRLEQNYRSTQQILDMTNQILDGAAIKFDKNLFSDRKYGKLPQVVYPLSDQTQARLVVDKIIGYSKKYKLHEIAVLFRAGYHSYALEVALNQVGIKFKKYGGVRFQEAAHIKDVLSYVRLLVNHSDLIAWQRALDPIKGVGPKTAKKIVEAILSGDEKYMAKARKKFLGLEELLMQMDHLRKNAKTPSEALEGVMKFYTPILQQKYPDDYPRRQTGLEQLGQISANYTDMDSFLADICLEGDPKDQDREKNALVLSTVHSSKGLEWKAVVIIDLVEERFPSKRSIAKPEDLEEERRLMYVACTRAEDCLSLFVPATIFNRFNGTSEPALPSPFVAELSKELFDELSESYSGGLEERKRRSPKPYTPPREFRRPPESSDSEPPVQTPVTPNQPPEKLGFCKHKIFGKGKIVAQLDGNKYRINFPGFGLKVIIGDFLEFI